MSAQPKKQQHASFPELLQHHGYAMPAIHAVLNKTVAHAAPEEAHARFTRFFDNYYMQFLALQMERYHFNLNRPFITVAELNQAEGLILGKHGNPPLDTAHLVALLMETVNVLVEQNLEAPLTWHGFFAFSHIARDGSTIRGQDILRGLIKSDLMHAGAHIENYFHNYRGHVFGTCSMMQIMAEELETLPATGLKRINRFGRPVDNQNIAQALTLTTRLATLRAPNVSDYYNINAHERIKQTLSSIFQNLLGNCNLTLLHEQRLQLQRDYFNPPMYSKDWQAFLYELDDLLQLIATPYA